jgi:DNA-binding response OmpR family regulator
MSGLIDRRERWPHALVLDMVLPGCSGVEICRALRADAGQADLVVVIVTGHSFDDASAAEVEAAGADWQFTKPISPVNLLAKLRELGVPPARAGVRS